MLKGGPRCWTHYYNNLRPRIRARRASGVTFDLPGNARKLLELEALSTDPDFWSDNEKAQSVLRQRNAIQQDIDLAKKFETLIEDIEVHQEFIKEGEDVADDLVDLLQTYYQLIEDNEIKMMLSGQYDDNPAILVIHPGAGGTESNDWAEMLLRMYVRYCEKQDFKCEILERQEGDQAGVKSAMLRIDGRYAYGMLKAESGVHRLIRISPFDAAKRRQTSFCSIHVTPEIENDEEVDIDEKDLRIDTFRSSGAGGQHVNTTDSAVRITHLPTGIVVNCQNERSQIKNRATAMKVLRSRLAEVQRQEHEETVRSSAAAKMDINFGSQIRTYVLFPYRQVRDHRTETESSQPDKVLEGDLNDFIRAFLLSQSAKEKEDNELAVE
ncbi:peptide chain release factor 2 [Acanthopleuribacter pedis]|uniref:peptide chain release factor 2 n=1 Tax=Acanthopleuribacter pedis TaxID=442870 RepID=UPI003C6EDFBA